MTVLVMVSVVASSMGNVSIHLHLRQKGSHLNLEDQPTDNRAQGTPTPWNDIKVFGEVSVSHTITHPTNGKSVVSFLGTTVNGRINRVIGRVRDLHPPS